MDIAQQKLRKQREVEPYHTCCVCGKQVYTAMLDLRKWVYKKGKEFCCSYTCYSKANGFRRKF